MVDYLVLFYWMTQKWGGGLKKNWVKKTYNYYPWNSGGGSYENLIQTPEL